MGTTITTMADATGFKKVDANGDPDNQGYAAQQAKDAAGTRTPNSYSFFTSSVVSAALTAPLQSINSDDNIEISFPSSGFTGIYQLTEDEMDDLIGDLPCEGD